MCFAHRRSWVQTPVSPGRKPSQSLMDQRGGHKAAPYASVLWCLFNPNPLVCLSLFIGPGNRDV